MLRAEKGESLDHVVVAGTNSNREEIMTLIDPHPSGQALTLIEPAAVN